MKVLIQHVVKGDIRLRAERDEAEAQRDRACKRHVEFWHKLNMLRDKADRLREAAEAVLPYVEVGAADLALDLDAALAAFDGKAGPNLDERDRLRAERDRLAEAARQVIDNAIPMHKEDGKVVGVAWLEKLGLALAALEQP